MLVVVWHLLKDEEVAASPAQSRCPVYEVR
jgi:hypothetical protein